MKLEDIIQDRKIESFKQVYPGIYSRMNKYLTERDPLKYVNELEMVKFCIPDYALKIFEQAYVKTFVNESPGDHQKP